MAAKLQKIPQPKPAIQAQNSVPSTILVFPKQNAKAVSQRPAMISMSQFIICSSICFRSTYTADTPFLGH